MNIAPPVKRERTRERQHTNSSGKKRLIQLCAAMSFLFYFLYWSISVVSLPPCFCNVLKASKVVHCIWLFSLTRLTTRKKKNGHVFMMQIILVIGHKICGLWHMRPKCTVIPHFYVATFVPVIADRKNTWHLTQSRSLLYCCYATQLL